MLPLSKQDHKRLFMKQKINTIQPTASRGTAYISAILRYRAASRDVPSTKVKETTVNLFIVNSQWRRGREY